MNGSKLCHQHDLKDDSFCFAITQSCSVFIVLFTRCRCCPAACYDQSNKLEPFTPTCDFFVQIHLRGSTTFIKLSSIVEMHYSKKFNYSKFSKHFSSDLLKGTCSAQVVSDSFSHQKRAIKLQVWKNGSSHKTATNHFLSQKDWHFKQPGVQHAKGVENRAEFSSTLLICTKQRKQSNSNITALCFSNSKCTVTSFFFNSPHWIIQLRFS